MFTSPPPLFSFRLICLASVIKFSRIALFTQLLVFLIVYYFHIKDDFFHKVCLTSTRNDTNGWCIRSAPCLICQQDKQLNSYNNNSQKNPIRYDNRKTELIACSLQSVPVKFYEPDWRWSRCCTRLNNVDLLCVHDLILFKLKIHSGRCNSCRLVQIMLIVV